MYRSSISFPGVRGSVAAPVTGAQIEDKLVSAFSLIVNRGGELPHDESTLRALVREIIPFEYRSTIGGNTSCVEVRCGEQLFILDMGTGLRMQGLGLLPEMFRTKKLRGHIFCSHVHWDHIQGFPFWPPLYFDRKDFDNRFTFHGGITWQKTLEDVLRGQMNAPEFPVDFREINQTKLQMEFSTVYDGWKQTFERDGDLVTVRARKLNHPQETYGYRIEYRGTAIAYTTDHEPFALGVPSGLLDLVRGADVWITDCQYLDDVYTGHTGGVERMGWGHSFPTYIATVARLAQPKKVVTFHHDPASTDERVLQIAQMVGEQSGIETVAAYEGMTLVVEAAEVLAA